MKALSHCEKFIDLSPERTEEVGQFKLSCHLNLSAVYLKLEHTAKALDNCCKVVD